MLTPLKIRLMHFLHWFQSKVKAHPCPGPSPDSLKRSGMLEMPMPDPTVRETGKTYDAEALFGKFPDTYFNKNSH